MLPVAPSSEPRDLCVFREANVVRPTLQQIRRFLGSDDGPTAVEYTVLLALILLGCVSGARTMGCSMVASMTATSESLNP
jgi:pilus assembly protein Flp/PilA